MTVSNLSSVVAIKPSKGPISEPYICTEVVVLDVVVLEEVPPDTVCD